MASTPSFPVKTALTIATVAALLFAYRRFAEHDKGLDPGIFAKAATLRLPHAPLPPQPAAPQPAPLNHIQKAQEAAPRGVLQPISPYLVDDSGALDAFYAGLHRLETGGPSVVVLHYGDSPTTADLITGDVRALLQARFGDAGHGYLLPAKPWAWYGHRDTDLSDHDWQITPATTTNREATYGLGGARVEGGAGAGSHITLKGGGQTLVELSYLEQPGGGTFTVGAEGAVLETVNTGGEVKAPAWKTVALPATARSVDLKVTEGPVTLFGEDFRTPAHGVVYDSLGLNGAFTSVLSSAMNPRLWGEELEHAAPTLVVINYGTNESGFGPYVDKSYEATLRTTITRIRAALPQVSILIMSPMDRGRRSGVNDIVTYDTIPRIVAIQQRVAAEQKCAFFDTFEAMGGDGTMSRWYTGHPRMVAGDLIHPTPQGAAIVGGLFVHDLLLGYGRWQKRQAERQPVQATAAPHA